MPGEKKESGVGVALSKVLRRHPTSPIRFRKEISDVKQQG
nr:MAG TPA: hypothetical protein [Caudoviricetes sp.]